MDHQHFEENKEGRDFVVGDLHGMFEELMAGMRRVKFDPRVDRMFSVGDLIDRGPESLKCLDFTTDDYFHPVRGNHEDMMLEALEGVWRGFRMWEDNGGSWYRDLDEVNARRAVRLIKALDRKTPFAITIARGKGVTVGICHAQPPTHDWKDAMAPTAAHKETMIWARSRWHLKDTELTKGVTWTIHGHTPMAGGVQYLGNMVLIDTGACFKGGKLTILNLADL